LHATVTQVGFSNSKLLLRVRQDISRNGSELPNHIEMYSLLSYTQAIVLFLFIMVATSD
jgi:hypothetical protein